MASIQIWNRCNNKCIMCANPLWFSKEPESLYSYQEIVSRVRKLNNAGPVGDLQISGGEPTIHPDFLQIMRFIRTELSSAKLYLLSNGRMFTYEDFTGQVMALSDLVVEIPVLGHTARLHDSVTGISGSFEQTVSGIRNILRIKGEGRELELRVILVKQNYKYLGKIVEFIHAEFKTIDTLV
ncbi:MAG: radical SAM protein, partial [Candidatus Omnitrophota bacterium]